MSDSTLDQLAEVQQRIRERQHAQDADLAERDQMLRDLWQARVPQETIAGALGISRTRVGELSRRARQAAP